MTIRIPPRICPTCRKTIDAVSHVNDDETTPKPGDFSICVYCDTLSVFADDLSLRPPTEEEEAEAAEALNMRETQLFTRAYRKWNPSR